MERAPSRRQVTAGLAASAAGLSACTKGETGLRVAVIGGGIVGASIAYHLAKAGAAVELLERHELATRSSRGTFAWLNASWAKQPRHYHWLNQDGIRGWKALGPELGIPIRWGGSIERFEDRDRQTRLAEQIAEQAEWGEPARMVGRQELATLEPGVDFQGAERAALSGNDGALDPVFATHRLAQAAERMGCRIRTGCEVSSVRELAEGVRLTTSRGAVDVNRYVIATGADPDAIQKLAGVDVPQRSTPRVIVVTRPMPPLLNTILVAPGVHIHQRRDGRVVLGEQDGAPDTEAHAERLQGRPNRFPDSDHARMHAGRILSVAESFVPGLAGSEVEDVFIGWRPLPVDGHPVLGSTPSHPASYIALAHSGVTLAPALGAGVADEILQGVDNPSFVDYRPTRPFETIRRY